MIYYIVLLISNIKFGFFNLLIKNILNKNSKYCINMFFKLVFILLRCVINICVLYYYFITY